MHKYVLGCDDFRILFNDQSLRGLAVPEGPLPTSQSGGASPVLSRNLHPGFNFWLFVLGSGFWFCFLGGWVGFDRFFFFFLGGFPSQKPRGLVY